MGISIIPNLLEEKPAPVSAGPRTLSDIALTGKFYRHPDSASISYPLVVQKPLGSIQKPLNIAIVGAGAAGIAALYELCNLENSSKNISVTIYESDPENFAFQTIRSANVTIRGVKAGRVFAAVSSDTPDSTGNAVYEIGAMRFPEIAGLMWHYVRILYGDQTKVDVFPNPGIVPTELVHGDRVDRFGGNKWLDPNSPTKQVVDIIRSRLFGSKSGPDTSLFPIAGQDPAKLSNLLKDENTSEAQLAHIYEHWKYFAKKHDERTLESAIKEIIEKSISQLPDVDGLLDDIEKINYYVELFGSIGFGTGGVKPIYNMALIEMMRLLLWDYSTEYLLPVTPNAHFIRDLYLKALEKNPNVKVELARVCDVCHLDGNLNGDTLVVWYAISPDDRSENSQPQMGIYDYVILASTPRQTSSMISRIGFSNVGRRFTLGDYHHPLKPENYVGTVRPAFILNNKFEAANTKIFTAMNNIHMASSSKIYATVKKSEFDSHAPEFLQQGKIKAILSDCGLGLSFVAPSTILDENKAQNLRSQDYYSFLLSYSWEDVTKRLQHVFGKYPLNTADMKCLLNAVIDRTIRHVKNPTTNALEPWWFNKAIGQTTLEAPVCFDWTTFTSSGGFKLDNAGDYCNSHLLFCYHTHALKPELRNKFFLANDSYSHLGGWIEGAFMSAVNAVCGLIVAANRGDVNALNPEAQKVVESLESVVENSHWEFII